MSCCCRARLHADKLVCAVRSALTARARQHKAWLRLEELERRESEARFHTIVKSIDQIVWSDLPDGTHGFSHGRWYAFTGLEPGTMTDPSAGALFHPADRDEVIVATMLTLATGTRFEQEYRLRHHDGIYGWVLGRAQPVRDGAGAIVRWYGTCTDIHEEVLARDRDLAQSQAERDVLWNGARDLLVIISVEGVYLEANPDLKNTLGYEPVEVIDLRFDALSYPKYVPAVGKAFGGMLDGRPMTDSPVQMRHRDGSYRTVEWSGGMQGEIVFASGRDVMERIDRKAVLTKTEAALRQSQKLEMICQLTGGVAHDLNNLLMTIRSNLELTRLRLPPDEELARYLDNALQVAERGAGFTKRMPAFARKQDLQRDIVDVGTLLPGLLDPLQYSLGSASRPG